MKPGDAIDLAAGDVLHPQHVQRAQVAVARAVAAVAAIGVPRAYGVLECAFDPDALAAGVVEARRLVAMLPGGTMVDSHRNADVSGLDLRDPATRPAAEVDLWIGVARERPSSAAVGLDGAAEHRRWRLEEEEHCDDRTGRDERCVRTRLLDVRFLATDTASRPVEPNLELLRVARLRTAGSGLVVDPDVAPPALAVTGLGPIADRLRDLVSRLGPCAHRHRASLRDRRVEGDGLLHLLRASAIERAAWHLPALLDGGGLAPLEAWLALVDLAVELAGAERPPSAPAITAWSHDDPGPAFAAVLDAIEGAIDAEPGSRSDVLAFSSDDPSGRPTVTLPGDPRTLLPQLYLAIRSDDDLRALIDAVVADPSALRLVPPGLLHENTSFPAFRHVPEPHWSLARDERGTAWFEIDAGPLTDWYWRHAQDGGGRLCADWRGGGDLPLPHVALAVPAGVQENAACM